MGILLHATGLTQTFPGVRALDGVDFELREGEIHALMGENGAGKSTLIKVLTGVHRRDTGKLTLCGKPYEPSSPADAQKHGVSTLYQEVNLIPTLSVAENLFLNRAPRTWFGINHRGMRRKAKELLRSYDIDVDVTQTLGSCPLAIQQMVGIARAVDMEARVLILDEPTSSLDAHETAVLFRVMRQLKARGLGLMFVTHFLDQVFEVSDRVTVLRNGLRVGCYDTPSLTRAELVGHMVGISPEEAKTLEEKRNTASETAQEMRPVLSAQGLTRKGAVGPVDVEIREGEILGLAGLLGSGRTELARLFFGADRADAGTITYRGIPLRRYSPRMAIRKHIGFCPEDRKADGLIPEMSVRDNIALVVQRSLSRLGIVSKEKHERIAGELVRRLRIATPDLDRPVRTLSGGNQQKVILARWLACEPEVLLMDEPTRGIDVGARAEVEKLISELAERGLAILFISSEIDETARMSHRVAVLHEGRLTETLEGEAITESALLESITEAGEKR